MLQILKNLLKYLATFFATFWQNPSADWGKNQAKSAAQGRAAYICSLYSFMNNINILLITPSIIKSARSPPKKFKNSVKVNIIKLDGNSEYDPGQIIRG